MKDNISKTHTLTAIIAIALASVLLLVPTNVFAPKQTASGVHIQGREPTISGVGGSTATSPAFTLAGLGQGVATATLDVTGTIDVICTNPGGNRAPGQDTGASGTSGDVDVTIEGGKADIPALSATIDASTAQVSSALCPNDKWTASAVPGTGTITCAVLTVTFAGSTVFQTRSPEGCTV